MDTLNRTEKLAFGITLVISVVVISFMIRNTLQVRANLDRVQALVHEHVEFRQAQWRDILNLPFEANNGTK